MRFYVILPVFLSLLDFSSCFVFTEVDLLKMARHIEKNDTLELTDMELFQMRKSLIFPGTKWCGPGNVAEDEEDLGPEADTDMCCRAHDHCDDVIMAGASKHNLTNTDYSSRLSCKCDEEFYDCLHKSQTQTSNFVGYIYFDLIIPECFKYDFPIKSCKMKGGVFFIKCLEYELDTDAEMKYQWFYQPNYT